MYIYEKKNERKREILRVHKHTHTHTHAYYWFDDCKFPFMLFTPPVNTSKKM